MAKRKLYQGRSHMISIIEENLVDRNIIVERAREFYQQLYSSDEPQQQIEEGTTERCSFPAITQREVEHAINQSKKGKAPGPDNITMDLLKDADTLVFKKLVKPFNICVKQMLTNRVTKTLDENQLIEKSDEHKIPLAMAFVDYQKAFDSVDMHRVLESIKNQERQETPSSPKLFIDCFEVVFQNLDWETKGIKIDGEYLSHLRFADEIVLVANNLQDLQQMLNELNN
nr:uncharacterized protein LOC113821306 [Penaeus vannamei]